MQRATASTHPASPSLTAEEEAAERFLTDGGPWLRLHADAVLARRESPESSYAFFHEQGGLRGVVDRVGLKVESK